MFSHVKTIEERFKVEEILTRPLPRYNIAPMQRIPVILQRERRQLTEMRWGLVPSWAKDAKIGNRLINARQETVATRPSFRSAFKKRRCLILADSFFEWKKSGIVKTPLLIRLKSEEPFAMAGLYEYWKMESGNMLESCTIVTTVANEFIRPIHGRMPVILRPENEENWLEPDIQKPTAVTDLLKPINPDLLETYEVSTYVNSPKNEESRVIQPVGHQETLLF